MAEVTVTINERAYRMSCDDGQERHLLSLVENVNHQVEHLKGNFGQVGDARLLLMASIMIADDLLESRRHVETLRTEIQCMCLAQESTGEQMRDSWRAEADLVNATASRIEALTGRLNRNENSSEE